MQLMRRLRTDESGAALITALLCTMMMLALGVALLAIVDTQANGSADEVTRDRGFNLAESVLTSQAFVLGRNWPDVAPTPNPACTASSGGFGDTIGSTATPSTATARLRPNLNASYSDAVFQGTATWQVNVCDDDGTSVWADSLLNNATWDANNNEKVWVRAQSTVSGKTRAVVGLVKVRESAALNAKYGLVSGQVGEDLGPVTAALTNTSVVTALTNGLITGNPPVLQDAAYPVPGSGVTGLRCGLLDNVAAVKTCVTGAIGALSSVPAVNTLVTQNRFEQFPTAQSTTPTAIGQMRKQAQSSGGYIASVSGGASASSAPACTGLPASDANTTVFIEKVGTGDEYCYIDVSTSKTYKAVVIGSGRVIIRGSNAITPYATTTSNRLTAVVYALNLQTANHAANVDPTTNPVRTVLRIEKGARVTGAVHADGKNASVDIVAPDFDSNVLVCALVTCPSLTATALQLLGASALVNTLVNGGCLSVDLLGICVLSLPPTPVANVVTAITLQLSTYGSAIHSDVAVINALKVYGASGVTPGTFRDLQPR